MKSRIRAGFTLVELMVAMALTIFVMVILSEIFVVSLETFSGLKAIGDMQEKLRTAEVLLRRDLGDAHFEANRRLSDLTADGRPALVIRRPEAGFFAVRQSSVGVSAPATGAYVLEGVDLNGMPSYRATDHFLHFSVRRRGNRQENFFTAALIGNPAGNAGDLARFFGQNTAYNLNPTAVLPHATWTLPYPVDATGSYGYYGSQWAEVLYYLLPSGTTEEANNTAGLGTPIFKLYRAQFVMVPDSTNLNKDIFTTTATPPYTAVNLAALSQTTFAGMACDANPPAAPTALEFYSPTDAAKKKRVADLSLADPRTPRVQAGATLVMPNVVSFHVQILQNPPAGASNVNFSDLPPTALLYDTTLFNSGAGYANNFGLRAVQITLRVWDPSTRQTRQVTIVQDM